jgi:hypothetical protein
MLSLVHPIMSTLYHMLSPSYSIIFHYIRSKWLVLHPRLCWSIHHSQPYADDFPTEIATDWRKIHVCVVREILMLAGQIPMLVA